MPAAPSERSQVSIITASLDAAPRLIEKVRKGDPRPVDSMPIPGINDQQGHLKYFAAVLSDPQVLELLPSEGNLRDGIWIAGQDFRYEGVKMELTVTLQEAFLAQMREESSLPAFMISVQTPKVFPQPFVGWERRSEALKRVKDRFMTPWDTILDYGHSGSGDWSSYWREMIARDFTSTPGDPVNRIALFDGFYARVNGLLTSAHRNLDPIRHAFLPPDISPSPRSG